MATRECYHCKQLIEEGQPHDCWTTTESALTADLSEDLQDAYERLRESAASLGEQRIYASHSSIMFSRKSCYFFIRPKRSFLEVCVFLGRPVNAPQVRRVVRSSKIKLAHLIQIRHRDEVEAPLTDWLEEAYQLQDTPQIAKSAKRAKSAKSLKSAKSPKGGSMARGAKARKVAPRRKAAAATAKATRKKARRSTRRRA
jgi:Domain of unknown function (DUF5655)